MDRMIVLKRLLVLFNDISKIEHYYYMIHNTKKASYYEECRKMIFQTIEDLGFKIGKDYILDISGATRKGVSYIYTKAYVKGDKE